jgi:hypothetical protein
MVEDGELGLEISADRRRLALTWPDGRRVEAPAPWLFG